MFQYPWGKSQQLNLNWFLNKFKQLVSDWQTAKNDIEGALDAEIQKAEDALSDVFSARDTAVQAKADALDAAAAAAGSRTAAAQSAGDAAGSALTALSAAGDAETAERAAAASAAAAATSESNAAGSNTQAGVNKFMAEAWAVGTMNGTPVGSGTIQYENNSKYYAEQADNSADAAAASAADAELAKDDADHFKDGANSAALKAEGFAVGKQNGVDVASGSEYYQNSAKYYKEQAAAVVTGADGAAAQAMISAAQESSLTASRAYSVGDYFRYNGGLYKVTAAIASGGGITIGTNAVAVTVGEELASQSAKIERMTDSFWKELFTKNYNYNNLSRLGNVDGLRIKGISSATNSSGLALPIHGNFNGAFNYSTWSAATGLSPDDFITIPDTLNDFSISVLLDNEYTRDQGSSGGIAFAIYTINEENVITRLLAPADSNSRYNRGKSMVVNNVLTTYPTIRQNGKIFILPIWYRTGGANRNINCRIILENVNSPTRTGYLTSSSYSEIGLTASRAYAVNDIVAVGNYIYVITAPISSGGQIIPGTNAQRTYITTLLSQLLNK